MSVMIRRKRHLGWIRDLPDIRDFHPFHPEIVSTLVQSRKFGSVTKSGARIPSKVDLRQWCSPIEDQGELGSCTANAAAALIEYFERRTNGKHLDASRLFIYKVTRNLAGDKGDTGAELRTTMQAIAMFGAAPEEACPYKVDNFDDEPTAFMYAIAANYRALKYYRHDPAGTAGQNCLASVKQGLAAGLPSMFGTTLYASMPGLLTEEDDGSGKIPFPEINESAQGGHAMVAVGYDDDIMIKRDKGALLVRNSWGSKWGMGGYCWLPYRYVNVGLANDFWSLVKASFIDTDLFR